MKIKNFMGILFTFSLIFSMSACSFGINNSPDALGIDQTSIAQTVVVLQTQLAVQPTAEIIPTATLNLTPTIALTSGLPVPTAVPLATDMPRFKAGPVTDVTYIDNTIVRPGAAFVKTWRVENSGSANWTPSFKIVFVSGDAMGGPASQSLGKTVAPGQSIDISVSLIAPTTLATFRGNWMLETDTGTRFGIGVNSDSPFWVQIIVKKAFAVTAASPNGPASWSGTCPGLLPITATITSDAPGTLTYYYVINGVSAPTLSSTFSAAGTNTTSAHNYTVTASGSLAIQVYIDDPNHQLFPTTITIPVTCTP